MMRNLIICCASMLLFSCGNATDDKSDKQDVFKLADTIYLDREGNEYKHLAAIPDSLQTDEQKEMV